MKLAIVDSREFENHDLVSALRSRCPSPAKHADCRKLQHGARLCHRLFKRHLGHHQEG